LKRKFPEQVLLSVESLSKSFPHEDRDVEVLKNVDFEIIDGEIVAVCGLSGVGKSTFLRLLAGLIPPTSGTVKIDGNVVIRPPEKLGFVTQDYSRSLLPWLTVFGNVAMPFRGQEISKNERSSRVQEMLVAVGLADAAKYFPWQLSGGMQQRVAIARALVVQPKLLLLDEPFASVDAHVRMELEDLVAELVRSHGITAILVTHDIDEAIYMADRVLVLSGSPAKVSLEIKVALPHPRNQIETRSDERFISLRKKLYLGLRK
jgi:NitT/TauT family transport system ATP-binding protein